MSLPTTAAGWHPAASNAIVPAPDLITASKRERDATRCSDPYRRDSSRGPLRKRLHLRRWGEGRSIQPKEGPQSSRGQRKLKREKRAHIERGTRFGMNQIGAAQALDRTDEREIARELDRTPTISPAHAEHHRDARESGL